MRPATAVRSLLRGARSRVAAALVDQGAYSLQNFLVLFAALHWLDLGSLGRYTLTSTLVILAQTSIRSLVLEPLSIRFSAAGRRIHRRAVGRAAGLSLALGLVIGAICVVDWLLVGGLASLLPAAALTLVVLLIQDAWRFGLLSARRTWATAINDGACLIATVVGLFLLSTRPGRIDGADVLLVWAAGTAVGGVLGYFQLRAAPRLDLAWRWLRDNGDIGLRLVGSMLAQQLSGRLSLIIVAAVAGEAALGQVSASRTLLSPMSTLILATFSFAVPEAVRRLKASTEALRSFTRIVSVTLLAAAAALTAMLYFLPAPIGRLLGGANWPVAHSLIIPTALWIAGTASSQGARIGLRALERPGSILAVSVGLGPLLLVCTTIGTLVGGGPGAAWGFGIASVLGQVPWTVAYRRAVVSRSAPGVGPRRRRSRSRSSASQRGLDAGSEVG